MVVAEATPEAPVWGLVICERIERGPGSVYPALDRLETGGLVEGRWETPEPDNRPRRRLYWATSRGAGSLCTARRRLGRWRLWFRPSQATAR